MPTIIKPNEMDYLERPNALPEFAIQTLTPRLGELVGSKHFMFDIRKLLAGKYSFPYHYHRNAEELMMIISGSLTMRTEEGLKIINLGEIVFFEIGATGAHQFYNHTNEPCVYLDIRSTQGIDVGVYPDSDKISFTPFTEIFEQSSKVEYFKGEENINKIWEKLGKQK